MGMDPFTLMAGASLASGVLGANASKSAASTQANAANQATAAQKAMFDKTVQLEQPYNDAGVAANQRLSYLLGIGPQNYGQTYAPQGYGVPQPNNGTDHDQITGGAPGGQSAPNFGGDWKSAIQWALAHPEAQGGQGGRTPQAIGPMQAPGSAAGAGGSGGAGYGSLLKPFDLNDFQMDPGTQFRIKYGQQALQNSQAAQDGVLSGSALKGLIGFNQDYAGLGYQSAFDRYMANKSFTLGSLSDVANRGQAAAGNNVNAAGSFSSGIANTITGAGNAAAAGTIGTANAIGGGLTNAGNAYMLRNLVSSGGNPVQAAFSQTPLGSSGFGTGLAYGNQDYGNYL